MRFIPLVIALYCAQAWLPPAAWPESNSPLTQHEQLVAVSSVDDRLLRYHLLDADSLAGRTEKSHRLFFHLRADSADAALRLLDGVEGPASLDAMPADMGELPVAQKKALFFSILLPIVQFHNETTLARRQRLLEMSAGAPDDAFFRAMTQHYALERHPHALGTRADSLRELLNRVDVVPPSLVLSQAAIESGWGTSRFARRGNNLYGQRIWRSDLEGMAAEGAANSRFRLAVYTNIAASVRSYMRNLNSHPSYGDLRALRAESRARGGAMLGTDLAAGLSSYSTRGAEYVADVQRLIRGNALEQHDRREYKP